MKKNTAGQVVGVQMITAADGTAFTGTVTALVTIDGGTQSASGGTGPTHEGNGFHTYLPTQAETNGGHIGFTFTGTGAIPVTVQVYTSFPQTGDNFARIGAAGAGLTDLATAAALATVDSNVDAILADTGTDGVVVAAASKTGYTLTATTGLGNQTANITGSLSGSVGSVTGAVGSVTGAVGSVTGNVGGNVTGSVGSLAAQAKTDVNAEVVDALNVDTYAEPGQGAPAATASIVAKIGYLYKSWRNKKDNDGSTTSLYADDATTVDQKQTTSEAAGTVTKGEWSSGP